MNIHPISAQETLLIRHQVLWPDLPIESCILNEDEKGYHFGGFIDGHLICVASVFEVENNYRVRKFAVLPNFQKKSYGTQMLRYICDALTNKIICYLCLDARKAAIPFYEKLGFEQKGKAFFKRDVLYIKMYRALTLLS